MASIKVKKEHKFCPYIDICFFDFFGSLPYSAHPHRVQEMLKYAQVVRTAAARHEG